MGIFKILEIKTFRSILWISAIKKMARIWHFHEFFHFYPMLDYNKIRTRTNFKNPNGKSLDLHLIMWFMLKELFQDSTNFTVAICNIPQLSKNFSAILLATIGIGHIPCCCGNSVLWQPHFIYLFIWNPQNINMSHTFTRKDAEVIKCLNTTK